MLLFPAIDLYEKKAVRLYKGRYEDMTVYSDDPVAVSLDFKDKGAGYIHIVDLEGAKYATTPNFETVKAIKEKSGLFCEIGGGIRSRETVKKYIDAGIDRVILGTAAVENKDLLFSCVKEYGDKIAVGADIKDGFIAVKGWTENSGVNALDFFETMQSIGVGTVICTDISRDGAMRGTNHELYKTLGERFSVNITASGGVSSLDDVKKLASLGIYGAIIGKAYYTGAIDLRQAVNIGQC